MNWGSVVIPHTPAHAYLIAGIAIAAAILLGLLVWRGPRPERRVVRLAATLVAVLAMGLLGLRPQLRVSVTEETAALLTEGADPERWREFRMKGPPIARVFSLPGAAGDFPVQTQPVPDTAYLKRHFPQISELHLFGHGLDEASLNMLEPIRIVPHLTPPSLGFGRIDWPQHLRLGEALTVQGHLTGSPPEGAAVALLDPGEVAKTQALDRDLRFSFRDLPKATGKFFYRLVLWDEDKNALAEVAIPVQVLPPQPVRVLILEAAPNFETKYLKSWLNETGAGFLIRSRISKALFRWESDEDRPAGFERLDGSLLSGFGLVIADFKELSSLNRQEREILERSVTVDGLSLFVRPPMPPDKDAFAFWPFAWGFDLLPLEGLEERQTAPDFPGADQAAMAPLPVAPFHFRHLPLQEPLVTDSMGRILAAAQTRDRGFVATGIVAETYRWVLAGTPELHAAYWAHLFAKLTRVVNHEDHWLAVSDAPVLVGHPVDLVLVTEDPDPAATIASEGGSHSERLPLAQDQWFPGKWSARWWPVEAGWHRLVNKEGSAFWFFAHEPRAWRSLVQLRKFQASSQYARSNPEPNPVPHTSIEEIPRLIWFLSFLAAMAFIWIERKWQG